MMKRSWGLLALVLAFAPCSNALAQFDIPALPDPRLLLHQADSALRATESVSYDAEHFELGTAILRDTVRVTLSPARGRVTLVKTSPNDPLGAKLAVEIPDPEERLVYDGRHIRRLRARTKVVYVNEPDDIGRMLMSSASDLIGAFFISPDPVRAELDAPALRYDGQAFVNGILCHIVYVDYADTVGLVDAWWFFGVDDHLPRKILRPKPDDDATWGEVMTLADLQVNVTPEASAFVLEAPEDYEVKVFQGFGGQRTTFAAGNAAPAWTLTDSQGAAWSLDSLAGKVVVMDFWATWCGPCIAAMPKLQRLHEQFAGRGVVVLGIATWDTGDPAAFMQENGYTYPLLMNGNDVAAAYEVNGLPALFVVGPDGTFLNCNDETSDDFEALSTMIDQHLKESGK